MNKNERDTAYNNVIVSFFDYLMVFKEYCVTSILKLVKSGETIF